MDNKLKLTIKANNRLLKIKKNKDANGEIASIEIEFLPSDIWTDLEFWLSGNSDKYFDYAKFNVSKRNKIKVTK